MSRRAIARRGIKKRGVLPSFGDMILPIVSIAAVALLIIAGRQFFLNGLKSSPGISSTRAFAEAPALIAERGESDKKADSEIVLLLSKLEVSDDVKIVAEVKSESVIANKDDGLDLAIAIPQAKPAPTTTKTATTPAPSATKKAATSKSTSNATVKKTDTTATVTKTTSLPANKQWRIQVGAYTSKTGAQDAAKKINKAGYKATVYQNPASKHYKVWVQGGADKKSAEKVVAAMKKIGFKGSFAFPPAK